MPGRFAVSIHSIAGQKQWQMKLLCGRAHRITFLCPRPPTHHSDTDPPQREDLTAALASHFGTPLPLSTRRILVKALVKHDEPEFARTVLSETIAEYGSRHAPDNQETDLGSPLPLPKADPTEPHPHTILHMCTTIAQHTAFPPPHSSHRPDPAKALTLLQLPGSLAIPPDPHLLVAFIETHSELDEYNAALEWYMRFLNPSIMATFGPPPPHALAAVAVACTRGGFPEQAKKYATLHRIVMGRVDVLSTTSIMRAFRAAGMLFEAQEVWNSMVERAADQAERGGEEGNEWVLDVRAWNELLALHMTRGDVKAVRENMRAMRERGVWPDVVSYGALIAVVIRAAGDRAGWKEALDVVHEMERENVQPNSHVLSQVVVAATARDSKEGVRLLKRWREEYRWQPERRLYEDVLHWCAVERARTDRGSDMAVVVERIENVRRWMNEDCEEVNE
ncbi:hypothetical protein M427DRAFT_315543 [Gonapodya prolifera JEL478]|uniref:Pentacotripeptide-repeat region of PRORP domain-containing protein n=1 Tax=Gonapodya prolifera (strain JEL478) TaxID=1344416 RepID=A0A139AXW0_GONPJ|nr:hypothetical protein M427DRAFT_315543 [Gonapodya prolifera JEL478]|eukprot:KXS21285.1 hypothetical protein M427DRAFT_315543 [Gonapodya prolifera JEL478]